MAMTISPAIAVRLARDISLLKMSLYFQAITLCVLVRWVCISALKKYSILIICTASIHVQTEMMLYPPHPAWQRKGRGGPRTEWRELLPRSELQSSAWKLGSSTQPVRWLSGLALVIVAPDWATLSLPCLACLPQLHKQWSSKKFLLIVNRLSFVLGLHHRFHFPK